MILNGVQHTQLNEKQKCTELSLSITVKEMRKSLQSLAILIIPELRHDLTAEAFHGVCHVYFLHSLTVFLMRCECMKQ